MQLNLTIVQMYEYAIDIYVEYIALSAKRTKSIVWPLARISSFIYIILVGMLKSDNSFSFNTTLLVYTITLIMSGGNGCPYRKLPLRDAYSVTNYVVQ